MKKYNFFIVTIFILPVFILCGTIFHKDIPIELYGVVTEKPKPVPQWDNIYTGNYQEEFDNWYNDEHPLRKLFVKTYNQLVYNTRGCINSDIVVGQYGWLYSLEYIRCGLDEITEENKVLYDDYVKKVKDIQEKFETVGKKFIYIISPNKVEVYPEFLPYRLEVFQRIKGDTVNNHEYLVNKLEENDIVFIDAESLLQENGGMPYFSKTGIHWNYYAAAICAKKILMQLEYGDEIEIEIIPRDMPYGTEQDIYALANIFKGIVDDEYYQVQLSCPSLTNRNKKKVLEMGTSFSAELATAFGGNQDLLWDELIRYQYFVDKTIYCKDTIADYETGGVSSDNLKGEIANADIVIVENNGTYIPNSHLEFIDIIGGFTLDELDCKEYIILDSEDFIIDFSNEGNGDMFVEYGFYSAEEGGRWAEAYAECAITLKDNDALKLDLSENSFAENTIIEFNDKIIWTSQDGIENLKNIIVKSELINKNAKNYITIRSDTQIPSPKEQGISEEPRQLAHRISRFRISAVKEGM